MTFFKELMASLMLMFARAKSNFSLTIARPLGSCKFSLTYRNLFTDFPYPYPCNVKKKKIYHTSQSRLQLFLPQVLSPCYNKSTFFCTKSIFILYSLFIQRLHIKFDLGHLLIPFLSLDDLHRWLQLPGLQMT